MPKTQTIIAADADDLAFRAAELFKAAARARVDQRGRFVVALSGGSTPRGMHRLLAGPPALTEVPWEHTHLFWVDERCVPASDPESNLGTAWRDFLQHLPLPRENIHFVRGDFPPEEAAEEYQGEIRIEELRQLGDRLSPLGLVEAFCALSRHRFYQNRSTGRRCWRLRQDFLFHSRIFMLR